MNELFVMRRANGTLFTEEIDGRLCVPVWSSELAVMRYKERNPELAVFLPQRLDRSLLKKATEGAEDAPGLFLLSDEDPDADLDEGRPVAIDEVLPEESSPAHLGA